MKVSELLEGLPKDVAFSVIKGKLIAAVVAKFSLFVYPPFSWILSFIIDEVVGYLYKEGMLSLKFFEIDQQVGKENKEAIAAKENFDKAVKSGDPNEINKAKDELRKKYRDLIRFNP